ncbi:hypothetical protein B0J12DRAFT_389847 [Macrophomina phaseolina]|uniref:Uncharacterized protein n=1 Tax=Macrophomina phaseolina TaxID=35725 RepID=A0ABQ8FSP0_9PEZI|nr:hypothetical protein B0J12DRAFT_389847 [Macrophomina phaseolina]
MRKLWAADVASAWLSLAPPRALAGLGVGKSGRGQLGVEWKSEEGSRTRRSSRGARGKGGGSSCELIVIHHSFLMLQEHRPGTPAQPPPTSDARDGESHTRSLAGSIRDRSPPCFPRHRHLPALRSRRARPPARVRVGDTASIATPAIMPAFLPAVSAISSRFAVPLRRRQHQQQQQVRLSLIRNGKGRNVVLARATHRACERLLHARPAANTPTVDSP